MPNIQVKNNAYATLASGINTTDVTFSVAAGTGVRFPALSAGQYFYATLEDIYHNIEIVKVTARVVDLMTVVRAQEGTTALAFPSGSAFELRMTAQTISDLTTGADPASANTWTSLQTFKDTTFEVVDDSDATKKAVFQLSGVATGTTRTLAVPDKNLTLAGTDAEQTFTAPQRGTVTADNDLSFDMSAGNNFMCTPTAGGTLGFTNITAGQSGNIWFTNGGNYAIAKPSYVKCLASMLATISASGAYWLSYYSPDGTNVVVSNTGALS